MNRRQFLSLTALAAIDIRSVLPKEAKRVLIDKVEPYAVTEPMFEGIRVVLSAFGDRYTPAYIQGISGAAFRIAGPCPCAPTCSCQMDPKDLIKLLGYEMETHHLAWKDDIEDARREIPGMVAAVKKELDRGRPVLVWHAFTNAEWDVVAGYDDAVGVFFGRGSYLGREGFAEAKQDRAAEAMNICPAFGAIVVGAKVGKLDRRAAEVAAMKEAVRHAHDRQPENKLQQGLYAYQKWIDAWEQPDKKRENGDSYCLGIYRDTHRQAARFLWEIADGYPGASGLLRESAQAFAMEADVLDLLCPLLSWTAPEVDAERNKLARPLLRSSRDHYASGISWMEKALMRV